MKRKIQGWSVVGCSLMLALYVFSVGPVLPWAISNPVCYAGGPDKPIGRFPAIARVYYPLILFCDATGLRCVLWNYVMVFDEKKRAREEREGEAREGK